MSIETGRWRGYGKNVGFGGVNTELSALNVGSLASFTGAQLIPKL